MRFARRSSCIGMCLSLLALVLMSPGGRAVHAQQPYQVFISVLDAAFEPVTDLEAKEVSVQLDGLECASPQIEAIEWPMKLTVLVDNGPGYTDSLAQLRTGLRAFFNEAPEGVETSLISIAPQPRWIVRPTTDRQKLLAGVDLLAPDSGAARFVDAIAEAADRISKDKSNHFPVVMMVTTAGAEGSQPRESQIEKLVKQIAERAATVHIVMVTPGGIQSTRTVTGAIQVQVGLMLKEVTGGRYEAIAATTRLATLLPEFARQITDSNRRQSKQYRISCRRPASLGTKSPQRITATTTRLGVNAVLTIDGHIP